MKSRSFTPDEMLIREAEHWVDCSDIASLSDEELLRRARVLIPRLRSRLDDYVRFCKHATLVTILRGKRED